MTLRGTTPETVRRALETGEPLPGTAGFAGEVDGTLVRDVLGRQPLFYDTETDAWSFERTALERPVSFPAGSALDEGQPSPIQTWTLPSIDPETDHETAIEAVRTAIETAVGAVDTDGLALAFSGGIDSALLAALLDVPLYTVGFPDSHDLTAARTAAALLDAELREVILTHEDIERALTPVVEAVGRTNAMDIQIALGLYFAGEQIAADGFETVALGQGADELFGGYAKVEKAPDDHRVEADTVRGARREVMKTLPDQLERDVLTLRAAGVEPVTPLLHDAVVHAALALPDELLVSEKHRKVALRRAVYDWLPKELACRPKKAMQYGTLVSRELDRLARQAGYKRRMDNHIQQFIESRRPASD